MQRTTTRDPATGGDERVLILSAGVGSGHNSAAAAVEQACLGRADVSEVQVLDVLQASTSLYRDVLGKGYFVLVEETPWLVEWGYDISDAPFRRRGPLDPWTRANAMPVVAAIKRFKPTAIVCTHFLPAQLLASLILRGTVDARTAVVTTDYDFQGLWLTSAFHSLSLAREEGRVQLTALGLPPDRVAATGIPIAAQPSSPAERDPDAPPALLVSAGASGGDYALAVVRQTLHLRSPFRPRSCAAGTTRSGTASRSSSHRPTTGTRCSASRTRCRSSSAAPTSSSASREGCRRRSAWRPGSRWCS
jgi:processive 1,2-diacylglycerol beta-glucosyltransferase